MNENVYQWSAEQFSVILNFGLHIINQVLWVFLISYMTYVFVFVPVIKSCVEMYGVQIK